MLLAACYSSWDQTLIFEQGLQQTSQSSLLLQLGPQTATQPDFENGVTSTAGPVNLTFVYPDAGQCNT